MTAILPKPSTATGNHLPVPPVARRRRPSFFALLALVLLGALLWQGSGDPRVQDLAHRYRPGAWREWAHDFADLHLPEQQAFEEAYPPAAESIELSALALGPCPSTAELLNVSRPGCEILPPATDSSAFLSYLCPAPPRLPRSCLASSPSQPSPEARQMHVVLTPLHPHSCATRPSAYGMLSPDRAEAEYMALQLGPDAFELYLSGPLKAAAAGQPLLFDARTCSYLFSLPLSPVAGGATLPRLQIVRTYASHEALRPALVGDGAPNAFRSESLEAKTWSLKDRDGDRTPSGRIPRWPWVEGRRLLYGWSAGVDISEVLQSWQHTGGPWDVPPAVVAAEEDARSCGLARPLSGRYLPVPGFSEEEARYAWRPEGCRLPEDVRVAVAPPGMNVDALEREAAVERCFPSSSDGADARIAFVGDSHMRMAYDSFVARLNGSQPHYSKAEHKTFNLSSTHISFTWDPFADGMLSLREPEADAYIFSTGAHQAFSHWPTADYLSVVSQLQALWSTSAWRGTKVLFLGTPAYPPRNNSYVWDNRDWRTQNRMSNWSASALNLLSRSLDRPGVGADVRLIDGFGSSLPFARETVDRAHYHETPVMDAWLAEVLHKLELCPGEDRADAEFLGRREEGLADS